LKKCLISDNLCGFGREFLELDETDEANSELILAHLMHLVHYHKLHGLNEAATKCAEPKFPLPSEMSIAAEDLSKLFRSQSVDAPKSQIFKQFQQLSALIFALIVFDQHK